jgi:hypothetical protein
LAVDPPASVRRYRSLVTKRKRIRRVLVISASVAFVFVLWWLATGVAVAREGYGACDSNRVLGMTKLGWSWSDFGFVCVAKMPDGSDYRYVVRWPSPEPPDRIRELPAATGP